MSRARDISKVLTSDTDLVTTAELNSAVSGYITPSSTSTLTNKTLTSPTVNDSVDSYPTLKSPSETANIVASGATGTINFDIETSGIWYYTSNASANFTLNFRYNSGYCLSCKLSDAE